MSTSHSPSPELPAAKSRPSPVPDSSQEPIDAVAEQFVRLCRDGARPSIEQFARSHPELENEILLLFPTLLALESAEQSGPSRVTPEPPLEPVAGDLPTQIADYRIIRQVGRGGMGVVFEAEQVALGRRVALKVLPRCAMFDDAELVRFRREARAAAGLHHTNIVPVFGVGEDQGLHYYAMQFIDGLPVNAIISQLRTAQESTRAASGDRDSIDEFEIEGDATSDLSAPTRSSSKGSMIRQSLDGALLGGPPSRGYYFDVARLGAQIAAALAHAHERNVLHRDIKPSNLILDRAGTVWIADFGLAMDQAGASENLTRTGDLLGTLRYLAPERLRGVTDEGGDVYAAGLVLYELLTLRPAFTAASEAVLVYRIAHERPTPLRTAAHEAPIDLVTIVDKAIHPDPQQRYGTADALAADLARFLAGRPISARKTTRLERFTLWVRRNPLTTVLLSSVGILLLAISLISTIAAMRLSKEKAISQDAREQAQHRLFESLMTQSRSVRETGTVGQRLLGLGAIRDAAALRRPDADPINLRNAAIKHVHFWDLEPVGPARHIQIEDGRTGIAFGNRLERYALAHFDKSAIGIYRMSDHEMEFELREPPPTIARHHLALSPCGRWLVAKSDQRGTWRIAAWDLRSRVKLFDVPAGGNFYFTNYTFSPNGDSFFYTDTDFRICQMAMPDFELEQAIPIQGEPVSIVCHDTQPVLSVATKARNAWREFELRQVELVSHRERFSTPLPSTVFDIAASHDGRFIVTATRDRVVRVFDGDSGELVHQLEGHERDVLYAAFRPEGYEFLTTGWDGSSVLWDAHSGRQLLVLDGQGGTFSSDGQHLARGKLDTRIQRWRVHRPREVTGIPFAEPGTCQAAVLPGERVAVLGRHGRLQFWDLRAREIAAEVALAGTIQDLDVARDGTAVFTATSHSLLRWPMHVEANPDEDVIVLGPPEAILLPGGGTPETVSVSADGRKVAAALAGTNGSIAIVDFDNAGRSRIIGPHAEAGGARLSGDGTMLVTHSWHGSDVVVWNAATGDVVKRFATGRASATFSPDDSLLAVTERDKTTVYETGTWNVRAEVASADFAVAISPDSRLLAVGHNKHDVKLIDIDSGESLATLPATSRSTCGNLCFSPTGFHLVTSFSGRGGCSIWHLPVLRATLEHINLGWHAAAASFSRDDWNICRALRVSIVDGP